jgi:hypothetical protein
MSRHNDDCAKNPCGLCQAREEILDHMADCLPDQGIFPDLPLEIRHEITDWALLHAGMPSDDNSARAALRALGCNLVRGGLHVAEARVQLDRTTHEGIMWWARNVRERGRRPGNAVLQRRLAELGSALIVVAADIFRCGDPRSHQDEEDAATKAQVRARTGAQCGDPRCPGYLHMADSMGRGPGLERCDVCDRFEDDEKAAAAHAAADCCSLGVAVGGDEDLADETGPVT